MAIPAARAHTRRPGLTVRMHLRRGLARYLRGQQGSERAHRVCDDDGPRGARGGEGGEGGGGTAARCGAMANGVRLHWLTSRSRGACSCPGPQ